MKKCEKCGSTLIPGENWYRLKADHVCCSCSEWPSYPALVKQGTGFGDYEEAILIRQDTLL
ncbi:MAG: hypothetical protein LUE14_07830 [Clostridiales bacterium]|nr:hypothetical protein [Clostridiales bacterium]